MFMRILKKVAHLLAIFCGMTYVSRVIFRVKHKKSIRVMYSHRVIDKSNQLYTFLKGLNCLTFEDFEKRIKYLSRSYKPISGSEYLHCLRNGIQIHRDAIILTFDDGYRCFYTNVFPLLKKYRIPSILFITTDCIDNNLVLLHDRLIYIISSTHIANFMLSELGPQRYSLATDRDRITIYNDIIGRLKILPHVEIKFIIEKLSTLLEVDGNECEHHNEMLSWSEILEMSDSGLVEIGSHTVSHPILTRVSLNEAKCEIQNSKLVIEEKLNVPVRFFAYPNGKETDLNPSIKEFVKQSGYDLAFTTIKHRTFPFDEYEIPRLGSDSGESFSRFKLHISGFLEIYESVRNSIGELT